MASRSVPRTPFADAVAAFEVRLASASAIEARPPWAAVLDVPARCSEADLRRAFRRGAFEAHPDRGGSHEAFLAIQRALEQGLAALRAPAAAHEASRRVYARRA